MNCVEVHRQEGDARSRVGRDKDNPGGFLWLYITLAGSFLLRFSVLDFASGDYRLFLEPWYDLLAQQGPWRGLGQLPERMGTYPPLYMYGLAVSTLLPLPKLYAIKLISVAGDYVAAWYLWRIVRRGFPSGGQGWMAITAFLFLPTVVMNGALWGQCDVMYTACFLASLYYLLEGRSVAALVAFGIAGSLKPQAIFWCPLLAGLWVSGRLPWRWIWIPPAVYGACGLPAILAGWPILRVLGYWGQVENLPGLTLGATNWYQWVFRESPEVFWWSGVVLTLVATAWLVLWMRDGPPASSSDPQYLVPLALLSVLFPPFFLPGMHERYFFAADVLAVVYAAYRPGGFRVALLIQFASAFTYLPYLFNQEPIPRWLLALAILAALGLVVRGLVEPREAPGRV